MWAAALVETLSYADIRHAAPVFHGDTLYAESTVVRTEPLPDGRGSVVVETRATKSEASNGSESDAENHRTV